MEPFDQPIRDPDVLARAQMTFDLCEAADEIMRQNIRRRHPELNETEVEERLAEWYLSRRKGHSYGRSSRKWAERLGLRQ
jgi:hypothetical protein